MKKKNDFIFSSIFIFLLIIISLLSHISWLNPFIILTNGDVWYLYKEGMLTANWGTWTSVLSLGEVNVSYNLFLLTLIWRGLSALGFDYQVANQLVYFFLLVIFGTPIGTFIFLRYLKIHPLASFTATIVYMFTSFFLMMQNGGLLLAAAYTLLPLQFFFLDKYIENRKMKDGLLFVLVLSVAIAYELRIVYISLFVFIFYTVFLFWQRYKRSVIKHFIYFTLKAIPLIFLLLLINAYIYIPLLFSSIKDAAIVVATRGLFGANFFTIANPLVLMHPFWTGQVPSEFIIEPIPYFFWIFPIFAFFAIFYAKYNKKILFFAVVALIMVFLGKSAAAPFGVIYDWLYFNFPGFGFFREPSKFWAMMAFSYIVLIGYTIHYSLLWIEKKQRKVFMQNSIKGILIVPIIVISLYIGKSAFTSQLGPLFTPLQIPQDHIYTKDFLYKQPDFFRTFFVPGRYRMGFWSEIHPMLGLNEVQEYLQTLNTKLLSLMSVKYIIIPPDITNDVYRTWGNKKVYTRAVKETSGLRKVTDSRLGNFAVYENINEYKPHIYPANEITYVTGNQSHISRIYPLIHSSDPTLFFENSDYSIYGERFVTHINTQQYENSDEVFLTAPCIRCEQNNYLEGLIYPYAKILPDSPLYPFIRFRENKELQSKKEDVVIHLQTLVVYTTKRVFEVQRISEKKLGQQMLLEAINSHQNSLNMIDLAIQKINQNTFSNDQLLSISDYLQVQLNYLSQLFSNRDIDTKNITLIKKNYQHVLAISQNIKSYIWLSDAQHDRYIVNVNYPGNYNVFVEGILSPQASLTIAGKQLPVTASNTAGWSKAESVSLKKGKNTIELTGRRVNHVSTTRLQSQIPKGNGIKKVNIPVNNIEGNTKYHVSFFYNITDKNNVRFFLNRDSDFDQNGFSSKALDGFLSTDGNWHEFQADFTSRFGERNDNLQLEVYQNNENAITVSLNNISVIKDKGSLIALEASKLSANPSKRMPTISFQWFNPTKYKVHIEHATKPFYLIFSEDYSNGWTAYFNPNTNALQGKMVHAFKNIPVRELEPQNDIAIVRTLHDAFQKREKIPDHIQVNGFANAWYITKTGTYDIDIEFTPQSVFYASLLISFIGVIISIIWFLILLTKKS